MGRVLIFAIMATAACVICGILNAKPDETATVSTYDWTPVEPAPSMPEGTHCWQLTTNLTKPNPHFYLTCNYPNPAAPAPVSTPTNLEITP